MLSTFVQVYNSFWTYVNTLDKWEQMALADTFAKDSLVWKQGMTDWAKTDTIREMNGLCELESVLICFTINKLF